MTGASTTTATMRQRWQAVMMNNYGTPPIALASGDGAVVTDVDGRTYIDLLGGIAVNVLGHRHPAVIEAVTRQMSTLGHTSNLYATEPGIALAEELVALLGADQRTRVFFCNSGAEANEAAFKLSRLTGRTKLVAAHDAFHGRTMGSLALTGQPAKQTPFAPLPGDVTHVGYGDVDALAAAVDDHTAAVFLEPIMGESGVVVPPAGYLAAARDITARRGALLVLDEVQNRDGPHRSVLRPPARRHHPGRGDPGQGSGRRAADRCLPGRRAGRRTTDPRPARQHLRRQPGLRRGGAGGATGAGERRPGPPRRSLGQIVAARHRSARPPAHRPRARTRTAVGHRADRPARQGRRGHRPRRRLPGQRGRTRRHPVGAAADHRRSTARRLCRRLAGNPGPRRGAP
ncbi:acetylornithine aminotransferase argD [Mycobacterium tuberculosis SUMu012]|nr:acetylornithine aminotransferase argD [Mycobacterium tuberculosis SUMu012]